MTSQSGCPQCDRFRVRGDKFCGGCGAALSSDVILWGASNDQFARRYTVDDVAGFWTKRLTVADNQIALVFAGGKLQSEVRGGSVDMGGLKRRILSLGRAERMTAIVMRDGPMAMEFSLERAATADDMTVRVTSQARVQVRNPLVLYRNVLSGQDELTVGELRQALYPLISSELSRAIRTATLDQLASGVDALRAVESRLPRLLDDALEPLGLEAVQVRLLEVHHPRLEELRAGREGRHFDEVAEEDAIAGEDRQFGRDRQTAAQGLRREEAETVDDVRRRNDVRREAERLIIEGKMAHIANEEDLAEFLAQVDKQGVLREQDVFELKRGAAEANEDQDLARQHLLATLQSQRRHELTMLDAQQGGELAQFELEGEQRLDTLRTQHGMTTERAMVEHKIALEGMAQAFAREQAVAGARTQDEVERIEHERDMQEIADGISAKRMLDEAKAARLQREQDIALGGRRQIMEMDQDAADREHARELAKLHEMAELSTEALVAISGSGQGQILAELKRTETLAGLSEEQILAMAAERSDTVAQAFVERFKAEGAAGGVEMMQRMYERMLAEKDAAAASSRQDAQQHAEQMQRLSEEAMRMMRDTATSAGGRGETVIVGAGGATAVGGQSQAPSEPERVMVCPNCHAEVEEGVKHCTNCGHQFFQ